jgi:hypothetical protein
MRACTNAENLSGSNSEGDPKDLPSIKLGGRTVSRKNVILLDSDSCLNADLSRAKSLDVILCALRSIRDRRIRQRVREIVSLEEN